MSQSVNLSVVTGGQGATGPAGGVGATGPAGGAGATGPGGPAGGDIALWEDFSDQASVTTGETDLLTFSMDAGQLASNGDKLFGRYGGWFLTQVSGTVRNRLYFDGDLIFDSTALTVTSNTFWQMDVMIIRVDATKIKYVVALLVPGSSAKVVTSLEELTGLTLGSAIDIKLTGQAGGVGALSGDIMVRLASYNYSANA